MAEDYENYAAMEEQAREALSHLEERGPHALEEDRLAAGALILPGFDFDAGDTYFNVILGELDTETATFARFVSPFAASTLDDALGLARVTLTWLTEGRWPPRREQFEAQLREFVAQAEAQGLDREGTVRALLATIDQQRGP